MRRYVGSSVTAPNLAMSRVQVLKLLTKTENLALEQTAAVWRPSAGGPAPAIAGSGERLDHSALTLDDRSESSGLLQAATACGPVLDPA
jgi:hypothetical protein